MTKKRGRGRTEYMQKQFGRSCKKMLMQAVKIAVGSTLAIFLATQFGLKNHISAGTITLLTLMATKWQTIRLSVFRLITFALAVLLSWISFLHIDSLYVAYSVFMFCLVFLTGIMGLTATVSVNAVIGAHLFIGQDFSVQAIGNEFKLVMIGILIALALNLFYDNHNRKKEIILNMRTTEQKMQELLAELAAYLFRLQMQNNLWEEIRLLEQQLEDHIKDACEYQENTFQSHPGYYIDYFEMRRVQCRVLNGMHERMRKIRSKPEQAAVVAEYLLYVAEHVTETQSPDAQLKKLHRIFLEMKQEALPETREEFESRAMLYHILMDMEEFLLQKKRFILRLDERKRIIYWGKSNKKA